MLFLIKNSEPNGMILSYESENEIFECDLLNRRSLRAKSRFACVSCVNSRDSAK